ncbi:MAG: NAD(+) diphosphatase [Rhodospirillaceae bacterium]|jgi:NAD+ diphosphatase|nr:NAD(+) diphosphatase [Rhodospirillaceae bacterium]
MGTGLIYTASGLDRAANQRSDADWVAARLAEPDMRLVPVWRNQNLVNGDAHAPVPAMPRGDQARHLISQGGSLVFLGLAEGTPLFSADFSSMAENEALSLAVSMVDGDASFVDLRATGWLLPRDQAAVLAYARGLSYWHRSHAFCGRCGQPTAIHQGGHMRKCTDDACARETYPRTDPAVIMLVTDDGIGGHGPRCLLGRHHRWNFAMYSTLAGFVEPGESLEEAVAREVFEEAGVPVTDVTYMASQPWPFPASLMLGYWAKATSVDINIDDDELQDARWFTVDDVAAFGEWGADIPDDMPRLPRKDSIARWLIETWRDEHT